MRKKRETRESESRRGRVGRGDEDIQRYMV
jgi:hypothetical protein